MAHGKHNLSLFWGDMVVRTTTAVRLCIRAALDAAIWPAADWDWCLCASGLVAMQIIPDLEHHMRVAGCLSCRPGMGASWSTRVRLARHGP
jgi:hypothetical protein